MSSGFPGLAGLSSPAASFATAALDSPAFAHRGIKLRRSRQRVDAGQPRNSYAAQTTLRMSSTTGSPFPAANPAATAAQEQMSKLFAASSTASAVPAYDNNIYSSFLASPQMAFYRLQQQALLSTQAAEAPKAPPPAEDLPVINGNGLEKNGNDDKNCETCEEKELKIEEDVEMEDSSPIAAKRSRVENIISNMSNSAPASPTAVDTSGSAETARSESAAGSETSPKSKRKSYQPQKEVGRVSSASGDEAAALEESAEKSGREEPIVNRVQELLELQRRQYIEWYAAQKKLAAEKKAAEPEAAAEDLRHARLEAKPQTALKDLKGLANSLKSELITAMSSTVDKMLGEFMEVEAARMAAQMRAVEASRSQAAAARATNPYFLNPYYGAFGAAYSAAAQGFPGATGFATPNASAAQAGIFPSSPYASSPGVRKEDGSGKRKRSKVTDTRLGGRLSVRDDARGSPAGYYPPTMVGHPLYGATLSAMDEFRDAESPAFSDDVSFESGPVDPNVPQSCTLTPMHLRKAKLMFFFTRYPSSTLIKTFFPDIRFNKNTTAQLVKWFSNFREFYYIQMEKYARQALAEGIRRPEDIHVSLDSDLYKTLNQHYNRNNHITVPPEFRDVVEATLREFFLSIQSGKDAESSWKKQIYKVIARLDLSIPDYFKNPHFLDQLE